MKSMTPLTSVLLAWCVGTVLPGCGVLSPLPDGAEHAQPASTHDPSGSNEFANRLYRKLADTEAGKNLIFSPFSIQVALAMCAVGAKGETRDMLIDLIGAPRDIDEQNRQYAALLKSLNGNGGRACQLVTANALWGHRGYRFKPEYKKILSKFYDGTFEELDFVAQPNAAMKRINTWTSDRTHGKVKALVAGNDISGDTRLILTNAIYFKGKWEKQFTQKNTRDEEWYGPSRRTKVAMMHQTGGFLYYENPDFQALDLPYKGGQLSLLIVLPRDKDGLESLEAKWSAENIYPEMRDHLTYEERVVVSLPRFKAEATFRLKPVLCSMGAELAFSGSADFSGIGEEPLKISQVVQKAFVEVNEEGTEAAAATAVEMTIGSPPPMLIPRERIFAADHPFMFFIRDRNTNAVLFSGRVVEPKQPIQLGPN